MNSARTWADRVEVDAVGQFVAINIDGLTREFLKILDQLEDRLGPCGLGLQPR
jgi:hypothetical protein